MLTTEDEWANGDSANFSLTIGNQKCSLSTKVALLCSHYKAYFCTIQQASAVGVLA